MLSTIVQALIGDPLVSPTFLLSSCLSETLNKIRYPSNTMQLCTFIRKLETCYNFSGRKRKTLLNLKLSTSFSLHVFYTFHIFLLILLIYPALFDWLFTVLVG